VAIRSIRSRCAKIWSRALRFIGETVDFAGPPVLQQDGPQDLIEVVINTSG